MLSKNIPAPRPECTTDPECPDHLACIQEKCQNPCFTTTCGINAGCRVTRHRAICYCNPGYEGDPYRICEERKQFNFVKNIRFYFPISINLKTDIGQAW